MSASSIVFSFGGGLAERLDAADRRLERSEHDLAGRERRIGRR